ncbi:MAG TPA: LuxR C-terminal-related transcriptional regulator [Tepidiformaceae bacterium]
MPFELLSRREAEVLTHVARGLSNRLIAEELGISPWTAKAHVQTIFMKLHVTNRAAAAALWAGRSTAQREWPRSGEHEG